jgi:hypothetical protein
MADLILFHHAQGLTSGMQVLAADFRAAGHTVHLSDLYDGRTFADIREGVAHVEKIGFDVIIERGIAAAGGLSETLVYGGFSLGALPAQ